MRYHIIVCILVLFLLAFPATVKGEKPDLGTPDLVITGDTIEDAELTVTVEVTGESITKVLLSIQTCTGDVCNMPVDVEMESIGQGQYKGTYSEFEAGYTYYQYVVKAENSENEFNSTDYKKLKGLPGYESNGTDDDDGTGDDDNTPDNDTDGNDSEDSPGFGLAMVLVMIGLLGAFFRRRYN